MNVYIYSTNLKRPGKTKTNTQCFSYVNITRKSPYPKARSFRCSFLQGHNHQHITNHWHNAPNYIDAAEILLNIHITYPCHIISVSLNFNQDQPKLGSAVGANQLINISVIHFLITFSKKNRHLYLIALQTKTICGVKMWKSILRFFGVPPAWKIHNLSPAWLRAQHTTQSWDKLLTVPMGREGTVPIQLRIWAYEAWQKSYTWYLNISSKDLWVI